MAVTAGDEAVDAVSVAAAADAHLWRPWSPVGPADSDTLVLVDAWDCVVVDDRGRRYIDARGGALSASCGYACEVIIAAAEAQMQRIMSADLQGTTPPPTALLARRYAELLPAPLERTFFVGSGSEATEAAVKMVRMYHALRGEPARRTVLSLADGYHGTTLSAISATPAPFVQSGNEPLPEGFASVPTPRAGGPAADALADAIDAAGPDTVAAFVVEPVLGVGGVIVPPAGYLRDARRVCSERGVLLVVDEVMTGFGRTGRMFGFERDGIVPDVVLTGKGVTGGYIPLAAVTATNWLYDAFAADELLGGFRHGHTNSGHPVACAAALAAIDFIERKGLVANAAAVGAQLLADLQTDLLAMHGAGVVDVRGLGLLIGVELDGEDRAVGAARRAASLGVLVRRQGAVLKLCPPLTLSAELGREVAATLARAVADVKATAS